MSQLHISCNVLTFRTLKCEIDLHSISHNITQRNPSPTPPKAHPSPPKGRDVSYLFTRPLDLWSLYLQRTFLPFYSFTSLLFYLYKFIVHVSTSEGVIRV